MMRTLVVTVAVCLLWSGVSAQPINRKALVQRHTVVNKQFDPLSSLSLGNGRFAFTVDITGLQSFPEAYLQGVPLGTQSQWGWHSFRDTAAYQFSETMQSFRLNGRGVPYAVQVKTPERSKNAVEWFRQNPHRLQLGTIGLQISKKNGQKASLDDITGIDQRLDPWTGEIISRFSIEGIPVEVVTICHQEADMIAVRIRSPLLVEGKIQIQIRFPYPNGEFKDAGGNWRQADKHLTNLAPTKQGAVFTRILDTTRYYLQLASSQVKEIKKQSEHDYYVLPVNSAEFSVSCRFVQNNEDGRMPDFAETESENKQQWERFWKSGGAIDLSGNNDKRAFELERRIVLSQYLTKIQCSGEYPPPETGLTYNSWFGKPHLEMHWWHGIHFALWGRMELLERSLPWYGYVMNEAKIIAQRQGYAGVRWQKMTDPGGKESPSSVGAFLIWQQPHPIYYAELAYREHGNRATLERYKDIVFATAEFMASYPYYDTQKKKYILGKGVIPAQERYKAVDTYNPAYELVYWHWALYTAQQWRKRLSLPENKKWSQVIALLSPLVKQDGRYLFTENATDAYTNPEYRTDHPSVLGALGMMPKTPMVETAAMRSTFNWIWKNWNWPRTWGWDFPMTAMTATRLGLPEKAIDALLMPVQTNTYLVNGHNYQDQRLTLYLPGNGGLLAAVAMMCAGYDGSATKNPGFPKNWKVKWEGLRKMP